MEYYPAFGAIPEEPLAKCEQQAGIGAEKYNFDPWQTNFDMVTTRRSAGRAREDF